MYLNRLKNASNLAKYIFGENLAIDKNTVSKTKEAGESKTCVRMTAYDLNRTVFPSYCNLWTGLPGPHQIRLVASFC